MSWKYATWVILAITSLVCSSYRSSYHRYQPWLMMSLHTACMHHLNPLSTLPILKHLSTCSQNTPLRRKISKVRTVQ